MYTMKVVCYVAAYCLVYSNLNYAAVIIPSIYKLYIIHIIAYLDFISYYSTILYYNIIILLLLNIIYYTH